ncbi:MAG: DUF4465 domain-containing protein [Bacteroidota bacterium]
MKKIYTTLTGLLILILSLFGQTYLTPEAGYKTALFFPEYKSIGAFDICDTLLYLHDGDTIYQLDARTGLEIKKFGEPADYDAANYSSFLTIAPDGQSIWTGYTTNGNLDDRIYQIDVETGEWELQARFPGNFDLVFWRGSIVVSGLNSTTWGDPNGIYLLDTTGLDQHRLIIEVGGNSAGLALDTMNLYYGTSYSMDQNAIYRWGIRDLSVVVEDPGVAPLQISDGDKLTDLPAGAYDCELDERDNLVFTMNQFGGKMVLGMWNKSYSGGYDIDTLAVATGEWDWLGMIKSVGDFLNPEMGNRLITFSFGQPLVDLHTADYPVKQTGPLSVISGFENEEISAIDLTPYVTDPDDTTDFIFHVGAITDDSIAEFYIDGDSLKGTLKNYGRANVMIHAANGEHFVDIVTEVGVWPEISEEFMVSDFDDLTLAPESYWNGSDGTGSFVSGKAWYHNAYNPDWFSWSGWAYSNIADNKTPGWGNQYSAITGEGFNHSANYSVGYPYAASVIEISENKAHTVAGIFVTNSTFAALSMEQGDDFAKKFGGEEGLDPDYLQLNIRGYKEGTQTDTITFFLADFRYEHSFEDYISKTWQWVDLSSLGKVDSLEFSLESSDMGDWGMNTPGYFCMDNLYVVPDAAPYVANPMEDIHIVSDGSDTVINISTLFSDPDDDDDAIIKTVKSNHNESALEASVTGNDLTLRGKYQLVKSASDEVEVVLEGISGGLSVTDTFMVTVEYPTIIEGHNGFTMLVYPNPSSGKIVIESGTAELMDVSIYTLTGIMVYENLKVVSGQTIDFSYQPSGAYILRIRHSAGVVSKMIHKK